MWPFFKQGLYRIPQNNFPLYRNSSVIFGDCLIAPAISRPPPSHLTQQRTLKGAQLTQQQVLEKEPKRNVRIILSSAGRIADRYIPPSSYGFPFSRTWFENIFQRVRSRLQDAAAVHYIRKHLPKFKRKEVTTAMKTMFELLTDGMLYRDLDLIRRCTTTEYASFLTTKYGFAVPRKKADVGELVTTEYDAKVVVLRYLRVEGYRVNYLQATVKVKAKRVLNPPIAKPNNTPQSPKRSRKPQPNEIEPPKSVEVNTYYVAEYCLTDRSGWRIAGEMIH